MVRVWSVQLCLRGDMVSMYLPYCGCQYCGPWCAMATDPRPRIWNSPGSLDVTAPFSLTGENIPNAKPYTYFVPALNLLYLVPTLHLPHPTPSLYPLHLHTHLTATLSICRQVLYSGSFFMAFAMVEAGLLPSVARLWFSVAACVSCGLWEGYRYLSLASTLQVATRYDSNRCPMIA